MKKKKTIQKRSAKYKWQKWLGLVCVLGLVLISVVLALKTVEEKKEVSAHPTNPISIGSGSKLFEVPIDGGEHLEYSSSYSGYRQLNMNIPSLGKRLSETETAKTKLFSSSIRNYIDTSYLTSYGNVISMQIFSTSPVGEGYNMIDQTKIILQSRTGEVLDTEWVFATPNPITQPSGNERVFYNNFFQKSGTEFMVMHATMFNRINTTTFIDEGNHLSISTSDNNRVVSTNGINLKNQSIQLGFISNAGTNISTSVIYPISTDKASYVCVEHSNGQRLGAIEFEASPKVQTYVHGEGGSNFASIFTNMYPLDDNTYIGIESMATNSTGWVHWLCKWVVDPVTKKASRTEIGEYSARDVEFVRNISDKNRIFIQVKGDTKVDLIRLDVSSLTTQLCNTFPKETALNFSKQGTGYFYAGQINHIEGEFKNIGTQPGFYSGYMDSNFKLKSSSFIQLDFHENSTKIEFKSFIGDDDLFIISGAFETSERNFIDEVKYDNYPDDKPPSSSWSDKQWLEQKLSSRKGNSFVSILKKTEDWTPLIKAPSTFTVNSNDPAVKDTDVLDRWLLTGSKTGAMTDSAAVQVYDTTDIDKGLYIYGIDWLRERINRNPKSLVYETDSNDNIILKSADPIDWKSLGFDLSKAGPQLVTYFVTDSQNQTSSTSTYVNNLLGSTVKDENDKFAIDAQNFHIPLAGIDSAIPNVDKFKELSKTLAWSLTNNASTSGDHGNGVDENGASKDASSVQNKLSGKVKVDETQLKALQEAKVAKPYPVDVTYKPDGSPEIVNRVWVFVTTDNTVPNTETNVTPADTKGVVIYADDYTIPYRSRLSHDVDDVVTNGNAKAYNYYAKDRTTELAPLPDSASGQSNWDITDLNVLHDPFSGGAVTLPTTVKPELNYKWSGATDSYHTQGDVTKATLDVTLTGDVLLNVRQVVQGTNDQLKEFVVPTEGYLSIQNTLNNNGTPSLDPDYQSQVTVASGKKADDPDFTAFGVDIEHLDEDADLVDLSAILPSFYKCVGYSISNDKASHPSDPTSTDMKVSLSRGDIHDQGEYWITIYLEPNGTNDGYPQPYSWDYKHNDLGKIVNP
ncbi:hypothetical protein JZO70_22215 [Enterococcus sp. 669A]|uniref:Uncharacterized protein n=1 Tax=Candidatus Enterococcus moelleringii TaxID=2815325 RepID=A0ABS3LGZ5_9ENTE|nr:hypothetical protein [Enterococcus sp. 669A]MBO1308900.1 hypothetical protein [Enterococcus sp. 669A]